MLIKFPVERNIRVSKIRVSIHAWISIELYRIYFRGPDLANPIGHKDTEMNGGCLKIN